jgi:hypothetical protein
MARKSQKRRFRAQLKLHKQQQKERRITAQTLVFDNLWLWKEILMRLRKLVGCGLRDVLQVSSVCRKARLAIYQLPMRCWQFYFPPHTWIKDSHYSQTFFCSIFFTARMKGNINQKILYLKFKNLGLLDRKVTKEVADFWKRPTTTHLYHIDTCDNIQRYRQKCTCLFPSMCNVAKHTMKWFTKHRHLYSNRNTHT